MMITDKQYLRDWARTPPSIKRQYKWDIVAIWAACAAFGLLLWAAILYWVF